MCTLWCVVVWISRLHSCHTIPVYHRIYTCVSKTGPRATNTEWYIEDYDCFYGNDTSVRGTVIYFYKSFNARVIKDFDYIGYEKSVWGTFTTKNNENILAGCLYRGSNRPIDNIEKLKLLLHSY